VPLSLFFAGVALFLALPLAAATAGFCARSLAFLVGFDPSKTGAGSFVSAMLLIFWRSPLPGVSPVRTFIALVPPTSKGDLTDSEGNVSRARNRALESGGGAGVCGVGGRWTPV